MNLENLLEVLEWDSGSTMKGMYLGLRENIVWVFRFPKKMRRCGLSEDEMNFVLKLETFGPLGPIRPMAQT